MNAAEPVGEIHCHTDRLPSSVQDDDVDRVTRTDLAPSGTTASAPARAMEVS